MILENIAKELTCKINTTAKKAKYDLDPITIASIIYYIIRILILINNQTENKKEKIKLFKNTNIFKRIWLKKIANDEFKDKKSKDRKYIYEATLAYMKDAAESEVSELFTLDLENLK